MVSGVTQNSATLASLLSKGEEDGDGGSETFGLNIISGQGSLKILFGAQLDSALEQVHTKIIIIIYSRSNWFAVKPKQ